MAINKQRILNELGSVMNQLQNAECGCMGKLFGNSNPNQSAANPQINSPAPVTAGESAKPNAIHVIPQQATSVNAIDPSKLYLETQNYLEKNLVEPTIKEVHNDLKSISPANTIMTNPIGNKMMQQQSAISPQAQTMMDQNNPGIPGQSGTAPGQPMMAQNQICPMAENQTNPTSIVNNGIRQGFQSQPSTPVTNQNRDIMDNMSEFQRMANTPGEMGPVIVNMMTKKRTKPNDLPAQLAAEMNSNQSDSRNQNMPPQLQPTANNSTFCQQQQPITSMPVAQNPIISQALDNRSPEAKFHEMFPGIKNGMAGQGNLGYDPIAMAMEMNSGNQLRPGNNFNQNQAGLNADVNQGGVANEPIPGSNVPMNNPAQISNYQNMPNGMPSMAAHQQTVQGQAQMSTDPKANPVQYFDQTHSQPPNMNQQNLAPAMNPGQGQLLENQRSHVNNNMPPPKNNVHYNALGQPVQLMPTNMYYSPVQKLPQTLSPQPVPMNRNAPNPGHYSNVRNSESKTSLMPRAASRSQLQHAYNQYRGAHSFVPQHNAPAYGYGGSHSDGQLNVPQTHMTALPPSHFEKVGGDLPQHRQMAISVAPTMGALGDVVTPAPHQGQVNQHKPALTGGKSRNGLQDMVYTSYPSSTAWSFHGKNSRVSPFY